MAEEAAQAAQRALRREADRRGTEGMPDATVVAPAPTTDRGANWVKDATRRLSSALDAGDAAAAERAFAELVAVGTNEAYLARARERIASLNRGMQRLRLYRNARWMQGTAAEDGVDLVVFWEPWCGVCREHMPHMQTLADRFRSTGLEVVGLTTLSRGSTERQAAQFVQATGMRFAVGIVPPDVHLMAGVTGVPRLMVLRDGEVLWQGNPSNLDEQKLLGLLR